MTPNEEQEDLFAGVNCVADSENMTDLEKKHVPVITAPDSVKLGECFEVTVEVGKYMDHPNDPDHFIGLVELYADHVYLGRAHLTHTRVCPTVKFCVSLDHAFRQLRAFEWCNIHGAWENDRPIRVTE